MKMRTSNISIVSQDRCTGCNACNESCPVNAISFVANEEGFFYPYISTDKCISCGICAKVCPVLVSTPRASREEILGFCSKSKYDKEVRRSTSGGLFYTLARYVIENKKGVVIGAAYDENCHVYHAIVDSVDNLYILQNSKYTQSDVRCIYKKTKEYLLSMRYVLFSGTPCQIAGLYRYLKEEQYDHLLTVDIVCHGVSSPKLLEEELKQYSLSWKGKVKSIQFRYKNPLFYKKAISSYLLMMKMERGVTVYRSCVDDPYYNIFIKGIGLRESCYQCQYTSLERVSDITLGDCTSQDNYRTMRNKGSCSTVLLNSNKGKIIWDDVRKLCDSEKLDIELEVKYNEQLSYPSPRPDARNQVYKDFVELEWPIFSKRYIDNRKWYNKLRTFLSVWLPPQIVLWLKHNL